jgi:hypothetical protein
MALELRSPLYRSNQRLRWRSPVEKVDPSRSPTTQTPTTQTPTKGTPTTPGGNELDAVIAQLSKELRAARDALDKDDLAVSSATVTLNVVITKTAGVDGKLSFTVPGVLSAGGGGTVSHSDATTTTIQVVLGQGDATTASGGGQDAPAASAAGQPRQ